MIVSINQPAYLPWLGYFDRVNQSDLHIVLDHVQFEKNSMINRNKIKTVNGWVWLSVPLLTKGHFGDLQLNSVNISNNQNWKKKHWKTLEGSYSKGAHFNYFSNSMSHVYQQDWTRLNDLLKETIRILFNLLGIDTEIRFSSEMVIKNHKSELILDLCRKVGADQYISGPFGRDYLDRESFDDSNIKVKFHDYVHPEYSQLHSGFEPYMSVVDLLCNHGENSLEILSAGQKLKYE